MIRPFSRDDEDEEDEARRPSVPSAPVRPSTKEVEEHMVTHMPFRSWCPHCVRGKAKGKHHRNQDRTNHRMPTVALDYAYMKEDNAVWITWECRY